MWSSGVEIRCNVDVTSVSDTGPFRIETEDETLVADALIVATGGSQFPRLVPPILAIALRDSLVCV